MICITDTQKVPRMRPLSILTAGLIWCLTFSPAQAGLHDPAEPAAPLETDLVQFLQTLRELRSYGPPDGRTITQESPQRVDYLARISALRAKQKSGSITADELASLGAYLIRVRKTQARLPDIEEAVQVLEPARRTHPRHFAILANLGTAYQLTGRLDAAASCLEEAYSLAPPESQKFERAQLLLVRRRAREPQRPTELTLDHLFARTPQEAVRFVGPSGQWEVGQLADAERKKLPNGSAAEALQVVQQLLFWLPDDGRLYWLFGELANAEGNLAAAYDAMNDAVDLFRLSAPALKQHRLVLQEALDWRDVVDRVAAGAAMPRLQAWVARNIFWGIASSLAPVDMSAHMNRAIMIRPPPRGQVRLGIQMLQPDPNMTLPPPPGKPAEQLFALESHHWFMIAGAVVLIGLLIAMQVREMRRRRRRMALGRVR
jgi:tetratricopeptide (TPR) repeat protein